MLPRVLRPITASVLCAATLTAAAGCGGGSSSSSPAQFSAKALNVCTSVAPRIKATTASVNGLDAAPGSPLNKLPQLASLLNALAKELSDLHSGLSSLTPPAEQKASFNVFLADLQRLEGLTTTGAQDLKGGTITGLQKFQASSAQLSAASNSLSADGKQVPGLAACKNVGK